MAAEEAFLVAERNPDLPHQIVLRFSRRQLTVSCNCRRVLGQHVRQVNPGQDTDFYQPMPRIDGEDFIETYNRPENHHREFEDKWQLKKR